MVLISSVLYTGLPYKLLEMEQFFLMDEGISFT